MNHPFPHVLLAKLPMHYSIRSSLPANLFCQANDSFNPSWEENNPVSIVEEIMARNYRVDILALSCRIPYFF